MSKRYILGIDIGATLVKMGLVDRKAKVYFRREIPTPFNVSRNKLVKILSYNIEDLVKKAHLKKSALLGIGIGVPGPADSEKGIIHYFPNIKGWKNTPLKSILERKLGLRVEVDNDVNAITLAEHRCGAGKGARNLVCLTLGTGVGGGIIINGQLYRGSSMCAGEVGHIPISEKGLRCNCGGIACIERYIGNRYILYRAQRLFGRRIELKDLSELARGGNKKAQKIWEDVGRKLGVALTGVVNLLNPDKIVIGGGVSKAGDLIIKPLRDEIKRRAMRDQAGHVKIVRAKLSDNAGIIGASLLVKGER